MGAFTQVAATISPILIALLTGFFAARERRQSSSEKILNRLNAEISTLDALPEGSARDSLAGQIGRTVQKYQQVSAYEDTFKRDSASAALGFLFGVGGIGLGTWSASHGGLYYLWWLLAVPAIVLGITGFFYELAGGKQAREARELSSSPGHTQQPDEGTAASDISA
ncbi:hypothetical protein OG265_17220 [Streptomyces sp. NBC_01208]|uniref:hypothetical protein n=1 Tax=Streptomyces sp. NBC_01208 TaxID=2903773 RepID=UPI002E13D62E|nr:hypothetical protein OG265_17220 [Streptomyces sp. NBC_01208]